MHYGQDHNSGANFQAGKPHTSHTRPFNVGLVANDAISWLRQDL